jgi:hypothetical protein
MSPEERQLLTALFDRVRNASTTPRDRDAEALIDETTRQQPYSTYYLAQAVIVQEKGLEAAAARIRELEEQVHQLQASESDHRRDEQGGGFLSSIFGSGQAPRPPAPQMPFQQAQSQQIGQQPSGPWGARPGYQQPQPSRSYDEGYRAAPAPSGPWSSQMQGAQGYPQGQAPSASGGFLRGALGTAAGVAGGMLLANSLSGLFGNHMSGLGLGSPSTEANPLENAPIEETVINNTYIGDDAIRQASDTGTDNGNDATPDQGNNDGGWQQADFNNDDQSDFGGGDFGGDDNMNA